MDPSNPDARILGLAREVLAFQDQIDALGRDTPLDRDPPWEGLLDAQYDAADRLAECKPRTEVGVLAMLRAAGRMVSRNSDGDPVPTDPTYQALVDRAAGFFRGAAANEERRHLR